MRGSVVLVLSLWGLCAWAQQADEVGKDLVVQLEVAADEAPMARMIVVGPPATVEELIAEHDCRAQFLRSVEHRAFGDIDSPLPFRG